MLDGKLVLVTGASRGIGQAIALTLGSAGATVIGTATSETGADMISKTFVNNNISGKGMTLMCLITNKFQNLSTLFLKIMVRLIFSLIMLALLEITY